MRYFATEALEKRAAAAPNRIATHAAYGALPGVVGGALLGGLVGSSGDGESHTLRDAAVGGMLGGLATGGRAAYKAQQGGVSRLAAMPAALLPQAGQPHAAPSLKDIATGNPRALAASRRNLNFEPPKPAGPTSEKPAV